MSERELEEQKMHQVEDPAARERMYVHQVYNEIASHFSQTRYKPWPIVEDFLKTRKAGSIGLDIGCGNGKYLGINKDVFIIGSDHSEKLVELAYINNSAKREHYFSDVAVADGLNLPHLSNQFDFAISIAVVHHFSSPERRIEAVKHIISKLNPNGEALIYVWALEQKNSRRGWNEDMPQDILVPWVLQKKGKKKSEKAKQTEKGGQKAKSTDQMETKKAGKESQTEAEEKEDVKMRYYHLYKKGELEANAVSAGGEVVRSGYEKDNWWAIIRRRAD